MSLFRKYPYVRVQQVVYSNCKVQILRIGALRFIKYTLDNGKQSSVGIIYGPATVPWANRCRHLNQASTALLSYQAAGD